MLEFKSLSKFFITGRGQAYAIPSDRDREHNDTSDLMSQVVNIDGKEVVIIGIEHMGYRGWKIGDPIGVLTKDLENVSA